MPSFDIVSKIDHQSFDNALNVAKREILNRYDFHDSKSTIDVDKKALTITIITENEMRIEAIIDAIRSRMIKQRIDPSCMDVGKEQYASGNMLRKEIKIKEGVDTDNARKIVKTIKDLKLKAQPQIMGDQVRVTAKKIDDLQVAIAHIKAAKFEIPLQFVNMK